jgi:ribonuclease J
LKPEQVVIITTGSQGEPMAALARIAASSHKKVEIIPGDLVIISANPIPGNEKFIYRVIDDLFKLGADVIYDSLADIHVSGHAKQEELKLIHRLLKPKFFMPVHGEYRMLKKHANLAMNLGMDGSKMARSWSSQAKALRSMAMYSPGALWWTDSASVM